MARDGILGVYPSTPPQPQSRNALERMAAGLRPPLA